MARLLRMPEVAANATEAVLADWTVPENASFAAEDTIATVETEKAVVDVEAEEPGVVLKTLVPPGAQVEVGAPIAVLGDPGEQVADIDALLAQFGVVETLPPAAVVPERREVPDPEGFSQRAADEGIVIRFLPSRPWARASVGAWKTADELERLAELAAAAAASG